MEVPEDKISLELRMRCEKGFLPVIEDTGSRQEL